VHDASTNPVDRLEEFRRLHVGRLLLQAQRAFNARAVTKLNARGYRTISLAHLTLLPHVDMAGTRITTLAERAGMTKQGMGQLTRDLEQQGYLTRADDPLDGRATLVRFTPAGERFLADAVAVTRELDLEYAGLLGPRQLDDLRRTLQTIIDADRASS
jgi:DNA-binding MarR family transcriptional regulator